VEYKFNTQVGLDPS